MSGPRFPFRRDACVPFCVAAALERPDLAQSLPTATTDGWRPRLNEQLLTQAEHWLWQIPSELPFEQELDWQWLAGIRALDGTPHCVLAFRRFVTYDANGELRPGDELSAAEVEDAWALLPYPHRLVVRARMHQLGGLARRGAVTIGADT